MMHECFSYMGSVAWLMPVSFMLVSALAVAALAKYVFTSRSGK